MAFDRVKKNTFSQLYSRWLDIVSKRSMSTVFDTPQWQMTWWDHFGDPKNLRLLSVEDIDGEIRFIAPLNVIGKTASFLGKSDLVDYHEFIYSESEIESFFSSVFFELVNKFNVDSFHLDSLVEDSDTIRVLGPIIKKAGWDVSIQQEGVAPRLTLEKNWDSYLDKLRKKDRHELRRKIRRLQKAGNIRYAEFSSVADVSQNIDAFFHLHRISTPEKNKFMTREREIFFRDISDRLASDGITRLNFLFFDNKPVAASLSFVTSRVRYLYNSGYDPDFSNLSVGLLNHAFTIRNSIDQGHMFFDFMRGNEPYKYHLGGADRCVYKLVAKK